MAGGRGCGDVVYYHIIIVTFFLLCIDRAVHPLHFLRQDITQTCLHKILRAKSYV